MKVLALDSSGLVASAAIVEDNGVDSGLLAEYTVNYKKTHSQTLLPMLDEIASMIELDLNTLDAIAVAAGPGSFTGLRIGSATAKGLANPDSAILKIAVDSYKRLFGKEPVVRSIHAGLECGLFLEKYPGMDMISFGPTLRGVHSPDEKVEIKTVEMWWRHLTDILEKV